MKYRHMLQYRWPLKILFWVKEYILYVVYICKYIENLCRLILAKAEEVEERMRIAS